ncbi:MAG TPA: OmpA family protein [Methylomirabilota bacterium]|jgi:outer membrane protein OmpA-like peptidoglycan-associated protein|nr:OmpA family protein [Methylomirabilota bacterium]
MRGVMGVVVIPAAMLVLASGCATKNFVREMVGKSEQELDQRVGKVNEKVVAVEGRLGEESQRVTKVEGQITETNQRVSGVETRVGEVGEQAKAAQTKADAAFGRADEVDGRLTRLWTNRNKRQVVETVHVQFGFDKAELTDGAQTALATIVKELQANPALTVDLEGYADPTGTRDYNVTLSQRRVESVRRYLIQQGAELPRIHSVGMGVAGGAAKGEEVAKQRRVTVRLMIAAE